MVCNSGLVLSSDGRYCNTPNSNCMYSNDPTCIQCPANCTRCINTTACIQCATGYFTMLDYTCVSVCPTGYFSTAVAQCYLCDPMCKTCTLTSLNCTSCYSNSILFGTTCINSCPDYTYYNPSSLTC
jgi:hypothetical protein